MGQQSHRSRYRVFLLRMWEEQREPPHAPALRFSLEEATRQERQGFADLEALVAYLAALAEPAPDAADETGDR